jgi:CHAT domain-containing protein
VWKVNDRATMLLMTRFYENLLGRFDKSRQLAGRAYDLGSPMTKADALHEAKQWLRTLTGVQLQKLKEQQSGGASKQKKRTASSVSRPFEDPQYWAAFVLIGDPRQECGVTL